MLQHVKMDCLPSASSKKGRLDFVDEYDVIEAILRWYAVASLNTYHYTAINAGSWTALQQALAALCSMELNTNYIEINTIPSVGYHLLFKYV